MGGTLNCIAKLKTEANQEELKARPLPPTQLIEPASLDPPDISAFLTPGDEEDILYLDTQRSVRIFKFNHKTNQLSFKRALPKQYSLEGQVSLSSRFIMFNLGYKSSVVYLSEDNQSGDRKKRV